MFADVRFTPTVLVRLVDNDMNAMPKKEADAGVEESLADDDTLRKAGHFCLRPRATASRDSNHDPGAERQTVHHRRLLLRDQGTAGGFLLIEARDLNEAIRVAAKIRYRGSIEVPPIKELRL